MIRAFAVFVVLICSFQLSAQTAKDAATRKNNEPKFVDVDLSGSAGNYNGQTYTEMHVGVNFNLSENFIWRNTAFKRFNTTGTQDVTGFDSGLRYNINSPFEGGNIKFFAGPGYRWAQPANKNALFAEAGAGIALGPLNLTAGAKYLRYDQPQFDSAGTEIKREDLNYFMGVSAGTSFKF